MGVIDLTYKPLKVIETPAGSNKSYSRSFPTEVRATGGEPNPLFMTSPVTIQSGKGLLIYISVNCDALPIGDGHSACSVAINAKVDGQWVSLGNSGYVITAFSKARTETYVAVRHIPFSVLADKAGILQSADYTLQVELVMKVKKNGSTILVNSVGKNVNTNIGNTGTTIVDAANQNHTTIIIEETD